MTERLAAERDLRRRGLADRAVVRRGAHQTRDRRELGPRRDSRRGALVRRALVFDAPVRHGLRRFGSSRPGPTPRFTTARGHPSSCGRPARGGAAGPRVPRARNSDRSNEDLKTRGRSRLSSVSRDDAPPRVRDAAACPTDDEGLSGETWHSRGRACGMHFTLSFAKERAQSHAVPALAACQFQTRDCTPSPLGRLEL